MSRFSARLQPKPSLEEWARRLGSIPLERICLDPLPGTAREEDLLAKHDREDRLLELVEGTLVEKAMGFFEGRLAIVLSYFVEQYLERHDLGVVLGADAMLRLAPGLVRMPDVSFISWNRFSTREVPQVPIASVCPDLAVEILSENNTKAEMERKTREYFAAGAFRVWLIDPRAETATVFTAPRQLTVVTGAGVLDGGDVLPGFRLELAALFQRAKRGGKRA